MTHSTPSPGLFIPVGRARIILAALMEAGEIMPQNGYDRLFDVIDPLIDDLRKAIDADPSPIITTGLCPGDPRFCREGIDE